MIILLRECYWAVGKLYPSLAGQVIRDPDNQVAMSICTRAYNLSQRLAEVLANEDGGKAL